MIETGSLVRVSGQAGEVLGCVEKLANIEDLPDIPGAPAARAVQEILKESGCDQIASISYLYGKQRVCFAAFRNARNPDQWRDLQGQALKITEEAQARRV